jgi:hypothetical protein
LARDYSSNFLSTNSLPLKDAKVSKFTRMTDYFNKYCAGKQSESAYKAAQKLNQESNQ